MGNVFRQQFTQNGKTKKSRKWYGQYRDAAGKLRRVALSTDKQAAQSMLRDLERKAERQKAGLIDEHAETRQLSVEGFVTDYLDYMRLKGNGERHVADTRRLLLKSVDACGFELLSDFKPGPLDRFLAGMMKKDGTQASARTKNTHRQSIMGFANWLVKSRKALPINPLANSTKASGGASIKRRAVSVEELKTLMLVALERPLQERMRIRMGPMKGALDAKVRPAVRERLERQGRLRVLLYKAAFYTGLRRGELRALKVHHLRLMGDEPSLTLPGNMTKNKEDADIPLRRDFASELLAWIEGEGMRGTDTVFPVGRDVAKHLKRDMRAAGIPIVDERGRVFDFHAFRKCTGTYLNKLGVPITTAQLLMRHSTVDLTANVYNDGELHDKREAVDLLPAL